MIIFYKQYAYNIDLPSRPVLLATAYRIQDPLSTYNTKKNEKFVCNITNINRNILIIINNIVNNIIDKILI